MGIAPSSASPDVEDALLASSRDVISSWDEVTVAKWLDQNGFHLQQSNKIEININSAERFLAYGITGEMLVNMTVDEVINLGIPPDAARRIIVTLNNAVYETDTEMITKMQESCKRASSIVREQR